MWENRYILAIEGRAAAGKTTLAKRIAERFGASVIHMDDFFLPAQLRTRERYGQPGGNIHLERFQKEILEPLKNGTLSEYRRFDCRRMEYQKEPIILPYDKFYIVEGAYSTHPIFGKYYDASIFADISKETQQKRIIARNGAEGFQTFAQKWIPLEENYFETFEIFTKCDYIISSPS